MGEMWKRVSPTEKEKYTARARQRYEDYVRAVEQWKASVSNEEQAGEVLVYVETKLLNLHLYAVNLTGVLGSKPERFTLGFGIGFTIFKKIG